VTFPNLVPRVSIVDHEGKLIGRFGDTPAGTELGKFLAPHGLAVDSRGDIYVGEVSWTAWPQIYPGKPHPGDLRSLFRKGGMKFFQICNRRTLTAGSNIVKRPNWYGSTVRTPILTILTAWRWSLSISRATLAIDCERWQSPPVKLPSSRG